MPDDAPFFTIVMPLYNKAAHIAATLQSIAAQGFDDYEVVVVDDGSTDNGPDQVPVSDGRVRLFRQDNGGPGMARNRGIAEARGTWIAFLDADDLWRPNHLATLAATIATCPEADVVATGYERGETMTPLANDVAGAPKPIDFLRDYHLIWTSATAVRATALAAETFGPAWPGEDVALWLRLALRHRFAVHPARTALYVQRTGGAMDSPAAIAMPRQPVFATIAAILADPAFADRHGAVAAFRNRLLIDYTRPSLFHGKMPLAREYLKAVRDGGGKAPWLYHGLSHLPGPLVRSVSGLYGTIRRAFSR